MVKLNKIYTRTGDSGKTGLGNGDRVDKHAARVTAYGDVDELNAVIGVAIATMSSNKADKDMVKILQKIQNELFDLGADLCVPSEIDEQKGQRLRITTEYTNRLESSIDLLNEPLSPLTSFILPGGAQESALLHQARTIARRAERAITELYKKEQINQHILKYINRLSDLLFVMARAANTYRQHTDILWKPGDDLKSN